MHFKKLRDMLSWQISETEQNRVIMIVMLFETNFFFFGSFDEFKLHQLCSGIMIRMSKHSNVFDFLFILAINAPSVLRNFSKTHEKNRIYWKQHLQTFSVL